MAAVLITYILLTYNEQRPFYLLIAIQPAFFFSVKPVSFLKLGKSQPLRTGLFSDLTSEGYSYWLDIFDKLSNRRPELKVMEGTTAIAKKKKKK